MDAYKLGVSEASRLIRLGELSPSELVESLLMRIGQLEPRIRAWVTLDEDESRAEANEYIASLEGITIKNGPIHHYGQVEASLEDIPTNSIDQFLEYTVNRIQQVYY